MYQEKLSYSLEELASRRRIAQHKLRKEARLMFVIQSAYDHVKSRYDKALNEYKSLDYAYAMKTKVKICPSKRMRNLSTKVRETKKKKSIIPANLMTLLKTLPEEKIKEIIAKYERN